MKTFKSSLLKQVFVQTLSQKNTILKYILFDNQRLVMCILDAAIKLNLMKFETAHQ